MKKQLKLYVWEGALSDYTDGIMFALAESADDARKIILEKSGDLRSVVLGLKEDPKEYTNKVGFYLYGGA